MFCKGRGYFFFVKYKNRICGVYQLEINKQNMSGELALWMSPLVYSRLIISIKCSKRIINIAFKELNLNKVTARTATNNNVIWKLLERFGFKKEGILRADDYINGKFKDFIMYSIIHDEWDNQENKFLERFNIITD